MRLVGLLLIAACAAQEPLGDLPPATSRVEIKDVPLFRPQPVDLVLVVEDTPAMRLYAPHVADGLRESFAPLEGAAIDVHAMVISSDANDAGRADGFISDFAHPDGLRDRNFTGTLADAIVARASVGASGSWDTQPLAMVSRALLDPPPGFLRDGAQLVVVIVADADDRSPLATDDYASLLHRIHRDVLVYAALPPLPGPRLAAFADRTHAELASIDQPVFGFGVGGWDLAPAPCFDSEIDPTRCSVSINSDTIERCGAEPCFWITEDRQNCPSAASQSLVFKQGHVWPPANAHLLAQCAVVQ